MLRDPWDVRRRLCGALGFLVLISVLGALSACTAAAGGGVVALLVGIGALTSRCYDYVDVTVYDPEGLKTCAATVTASRNDSGEHFELESCYYAPLTDGHWTVRASRPGSPDVDTMLDVDHANDCTRQVQSVVLTLGDVAPPKRPEARPAAPAAAVPAASSPATAASSAFPQGVEQPPSESATPSNVPASNAAAGASSDTPPAVGGASSIGVFPSATDLAH